MQGSGKSSHPNQMMEESPTRKSYSWLNLIMFSKYYTNIHQFALYIFKYRCLELVFIGSYKQNIRHLVPRLIEADFSPRVNDGSKLLGLNCLATNSAQSIVLYIINIKLFAEYLSHLFSLRKKFLINLRTLSFPLRFSIGRNWQAHGCACL